MNQILFPTDFSPSSGRALQWAWMIARRTASNLHLLHAYHFHMSENPTPESLEEMETNLQKQIAAVESQPGTGAVPVITTSVKSDFAADAILAHAHQTPGCWVVMGTHGAGEIEGILMGSVASRVVMESTAPVWVIPKNTELYVPEHFIFATHLGKESLPHLESLARIAQAFDAYVDILHVQVPGEGERNEEIENFRKAAEKSVPAGKLRFHLVKAVSVEEGIALFSEQTENPVIAMHHHKRGFLASLFERSHSKQMALHTTRPLIVFPG